MAVWPVDGPWCREQALVDSIFNEVDEEGRREQLKKLWDRSVASS